MTSPAIEAKSLSSLTALASNPPAYPRNPTHVKHEPLVLYIARVPGSKDVFLSPMKPREKIVTAEDIQSSLYFVHVEQPEDVHLVACPDFREPDYSEQYRTSPQRSPAPPVQRKAVPGFPSASGLAPTPLRKPVPGALAPISNFESKQNVSVGGYSQKTEMLGPDYSVRRSYDSSQYRQENERPAASPRRSSERPQPTGTSLTLIRRDPASGAQWNVARIEDPPILEISSATLNDPATKKRMGAPMYIEVFNPGYSKFLHSDATDKPVLSSRPGNMAVRPHQTGISSQLQRPERPPSNRLVESDNIFRRRLWMEGSQHTNGGFGHRKNGSNDYVTGRPNSQGSYSGQADRTSMGIRPQPSPSFLTRDDQMYSTIQVSDRLSSFRGYVFTSPWNGRCEFITGAGGGSLKCRHIVPGLQGAPSAAMQVSELRFNLPSSSKAVTPRTEETSKRSSLFHRGRHSRNNSSVSIKRDDSTEDARNSLDRLDLSLGQEFAGGGFGGKQAKLGKIILEDEGLKMMDLLVAANLGLWWRAYEKARTTSRGDRGAF
ncbi:Nn.00g109300.m01.CDS01 [Neocucurbitaria sp. VM-36]